MQLTFRFAQIFSVAQSHLAQPFLYHVGEASTTLRSCESIKGLIEILYPLESMLVQVDRFRTNLNAAEENERGLMWGIFEEFKATI